MTTPSAAAVRAAEALSGLDIVTTAQYLRAAHIIDAEFRDLVEALRRLASMEGFTASGTLNPERGAELIARINYARAELAKYEETP